MPDKERYWREKLPEGYHLYHLPNDDGYWWVEGRCGFHVSIEGSPKEAVIAALIKIKDAIVVRIAKSLDKEYARRNPGSPSWFYGWEQVEEKWSKYVLTSQTSL